MSKFREKVEAQTEEMIGQMISDELLVKEGKERHGRWDPSKRRIYP